MNEISKIHIGQLIRQQLEERRMAITDFAAMLHYERTNVYKIFKRKSIDVELLIRVSEILQYDFLAEVYQCGTPPEPRYVLTIELNTHDAHDMEILQLLLEYKKISVSNIHDTLT